MSIEKSDFEAVTEQDLQELVQAQVPEGLRLEFKQSEYGTSDAKKRELLKDVSALANTHGGHLLIGVKEKNGIAKAIVGICGLDPDAEIQRIEQIVRSGLDPPVLGIRTKAVRLLNGENVIIMRIPRSFNPPHRVAAQDTNRFYVRHSSGVHQPSIEELRSLFTQSASALTDARAFRDNRLELIVNGQAPRPLSENGRFVLHVCPVAAFTGMFQLDVDAVFDQNLNFKPISCLGWSPRFNFEGFICERGDDLGYTQVFRNGGLEAVIAGIFDLDPNENRWIGGNKLEREVFAALSPYLEGLRNIDVPPPLIILISLVTVKDAFYIVSQNPMDHERLPKDRLLLPECLLEDYGTEVDHHSAVRPAFDALWNAIGYPRSQWFNEEGLWVGPQR